MQLTLPSQELNAKSIWYTDGSKQVSDAGGLMLLQLELSETREISHSINPRGSDARNTITRAELAARASALLLKGQEQDDVTATDSQASTCTIAKYIDSPQALQQRNARSC